MNLPSDGERAQDALNLLLIIGEALGFALGVPDDVMTETRQFLAEAEASAQERGALERDTVEMHMRTFAAYEAFRAVAKEIHPVMAGLNRQVRRPKKVRGR